MINLSKGTLTYTRVCTLVEDELTVPVTPYYVQKDLGPNLTPTALLSWRTVQMTILSRSTHL